MSASTPDVMGGGNVRGWASLTVGGHITTLEGKRGRVNLANLA